MKFNIEVIRYIFIVVSVIGLVYQTMILYQGYMSGKTVTSINVERLYFQRLPGITLCYENGLSKNILNILNKNQTTVNLSEKITKLYRKYGPDIFINNFTLTHHLIQVKLLPMTANESINQELYFDGEYDNYIGKPFRKYRGCP